MPLAAYATHAQDAVTLTSPDRAVRATLDVAGGQLRYAVALGGEDVLLPSPFALSFAGAPDFARTSASLAWSGAAWTRRGSGSGASAPTSATASRR